ncbi:MAG: radical SAM protein [Crocinitomicaceae bacterium]|nr:MAG: radical SAM protein [Crocinitomicaceae bacterium]
MQKELLIITPPFTQLNTPYPASAYLKGFLNTKEISCVQADLGIEVILELFSKKGLTELFESIDLEKQDLSENAHRIVQLKATYIRLIDPIIQFLQGKNPTFALAICQADFLPQASRFEQLDDLEWAFGGMGTQDKAKHLSTLFLEDLSDLIIEAVDPHFGFSRYADKLGMSANSFDELHANLQAENTYIDAINLRILKDRIERVNPKMIAFSVPFPGNLYAAFRSAQFIKKQFPSIKTAMGGGFPNTELRQLSDPRVFDYFDFITLDDGEAPIENLIEHVNGKRTIAELKRTFVCRDGKVEYMNGSTTPDYKQKHVGTPDYSDLLLDQYISVIEIANPMHRMWSDGRWNKLTMAHGCYWGKCTFCDISLDYIKIYEPLAAKVLVDRMEELIQQTGQNGFHFVDEAAPPALMRELALEILRRNLVVSWWTNIRFEKKFTRDLCLLLKASGCIAVSGGLEVASDRLLKLIDKGVTVEQVAQVTHHFTDAGILVHAYLMYGFPTQTVQETIDSLEMVRQLFEIGVVQSGFWHQFALTAHSPVGLNPDDFAIERDTEIGTFANNDVQYTDKTGIDHGKFNFGLKKSLYNYMHGIGFEIPVHEWFEFKVPRTKIPNNFIETAIETEDFAFTAPNSKVVWIGAQPQLAFFTKTKKGRTFEQAALLFHGNSASEELIMTKEEALWIMELLPLIDRTQKKILTFKEVETHYYTMNSEDFEPFWYGKSLAVLKELGLLIV